MHLRYPRKTDPGRSRRCHFRSADATSTGDKSTLRQQRSISACQMPLRDRRNADPGHCRTCFATKLRIFLPPWEKPEKALKRTKNTQNAPYSPEKVRFGPIPALFRTPKLLTKQFRPQRTKKIFFTLIIDNSLGSTFLRLKNRFSRRQIRV